VGSVTYTKAQPTQNLVVLFILYYFVLGSLGFILCYFVLFCFLKAAPGVQGTLCFEKPPRRTREYFFLKAAAPGV